MDMLGIEFKDKTLEEGFEAYSKRLVDLGWVKKARFEKLSAEKFVLHIDECPYARILHPLLKPEHAICRYALVAMAMYEKLTGKWVEITDSEFHEEGTKTVIEPV